MKHFKNPQKRTNVHKLVKDKLGFSEQFKKVSLFFKADSHGEPLRYLCVKYRKLVAISFTIWLLYDYKISNIFVGAHSVRL